MAFNEELAQRLRDVLAGQSDLVEKKMFGGIGFMLQGNMACGVNSDVLVLRIDPCQRTDSHTASRQAF